MRPHRGRGGLSTGARAVTAMVAAVATLQVGGAREPAGAAARSGEAARPAVSWESARITDTLSDAGFFALAAGEPSTERCDDPVAVFDGGTELGSLCAAEARREGLTVVDLSDDWVPRALREPEDGPEPQPYRSTYVALANERFPRGAAGERPRRDRFLELYGIFPSLRVASARLLDEERHGCDSGVDTSALDGIAVGSLLSDVRLTPEIEAAFAALDRRLVCERLLPSTSGRRHLWQLQEAVEAFQRKHMIVSRSALDAETRRALAADSRELDFRTLLRALRARVVDATGLIEDGTAVGARGEILSRRIDGDAFYQSDGSEPLEGGAPDLISPATEAAARALGWTDPDAASEFFRIRGPGATRKIVVGLPLPPAPAYHSAHMQLEVEIDRGDVWYELPGRRGPIAHRPKLTLFATGSGGEEVALVRWPTTIGGWMKEQGRGGRLGLRYKNSDVGLRLWRDLVVSPAWLPPPQTPARALVHRSNGPDRWLPDTELVGPGYASAYGLVMLVHHRLLEDADGELWYDNGIRTHGSVSYRSILRSESHGCHRLFNDAAVQLASFLLRHRDHVTRGLVAKQFTHEFAWRGLALRIPIPHRGFAFELTPPVEVNVLEGTVRGRIHRVPKGLVRLYRAGTFARAAGALAPPR